MIIVHTSDDYHPLTSAREMLIYSVKNRHSLADAIITCLEHLAAGGRMLECRRAYRQTFCHDSWHVKQTAGAMLLVNLGITYTLRLPRLA